ncbi:hypothetical protein T069G_05044 [Trichoderma breve]|uniref:GST C-terminal domain-containing protein n=1 Tax=Trichoderma breve TaxID=2034170 RepID=A0A9W9BHU5_9HYPO|nr:hypothetical protein T069G_05044 [Trichoderma breve]KAJ4860056.1 hypothetical protein T069G_05044 [Trichoderma breve]
MPSAQQVYHDKGRFTRPDSIFRNFISKDPNSQFPAEKGRYALYLSPGCPWAHRTMIVRLLKGLDSIIDVYQVHFHMGPEGWYFSGEGGSLTEDPLHGFKKLKELYLKADPNYTEIIRMLYSEFDEFLPEHLREENRPGKGLYPPQLRAEIDEMNDWVYNTVNNGVYKVGFSRSQESYDENIRPLFASLDRLEEHLGHGKPFLFGDFITEADIRLYTTLARFDVAYHSVFQCNLKLIRHDYPRLHSWLRRLYWDQDEEGPLRAAFYRTTEPNIGRYALGYADSKWRIVQESQGPLIVPAGPLVLMEPL